MTVAIGRCRGRGLGRTRTVAPTRAGTVIAVSQASRTPSFLSERARRVSSETTEPTTVETFSIETIDNDRASSLLRVIAPS